MSEGDEVEMVFGGDPQVPGPEVFARARDADSWYRAGATLGYRWRL